ncbi:hypothetical protein SAMN04515673_101477 [Poseidonocella sedimentorum]|uniref:Uncharacterized protein n=2 Tax=Poseidonocella sedimentorum TaxID=871652 RepID=A0A1I6CWB7_9RHOB|nr:hypothetical protein SAMN04515673_101477 [Poseidonocella sedimentorum]
MGRSSLLRGGLISSGRTRRFALRLLGGATILGLFALIGAGVVLEWFPKTGPTLLFYIFHDQVWLPVRGTVWTADFPGVLIWVVPVVGLLLAISVEFFGLWGILRRTQVKVLRFLLRGRGAGFVLSWHRAIMPFGLRAEQAETILREDRDALTSELLELDEEIASGGLSELVDRQRQIIRFGGLDQKDLGSLLETLALVGFLTQADEATPASFVRMLRQIEDDPGWRDLIEALINGVEARKVVDWSTSRLSEVSPLRLAGQTLAVAVEASRNPQPALLVWFDAWARQRMAPLGGGSSLFVAEDLITFEAWADIAETAISGPQVSAMMKNAFHGLNATRSRGEIFARRGPQAEKGAL